MTSCCGEAVGEAERLAAEGFMVGLIVPLDRMSAMTKLVVGSTGRRLA